MEWAFTWSFWLNVVAGAIGLLLAGVVLWQRLPLRIGLPLVAVLLLEALQFMTDSLAWLVHFQDPRLGTGFLYVALTSGLLLAPAYLWFLALVVPGKATAPLRSKVGRVLVWVYTAIIVLNVLLLVVADTLWPIQPLILIPFLWAVVAGVHAVVASTPGTAERRRGTALLLAFGTRDVLWLLLLMNAFAAYEYLPGDVITATHIQQIPLDYVVIGIVAMLYFPAITYAVLSGRIVDVERQFRTGVTQTTAAAAVAVLFLVGTEVIETLIDTESKLASVGVAVVLALLFRPIQMLAARLTLRFFPSSEDDDAQAFYLEQCRLAMADGKVTDKERRMLDDMARRLGLGEHAQVIEASVLAEQRAA